MTPSTSIRLLGIAALAGASLLWAGCENNTAPTPPTPPTTTSAASAAADAALKAAQAKLNEVTAYIKDNKLDAADKALTALEENKASLPEAIQKQLPEVRSTLDAAKKAAGGMKLPGT